MSLFAGLPTSLRIGPHDLAVEVMPAEWGDNQSSYGEYDERHQRIRVAETLPSPVFAVDVVLHEVLHAIYQTAHMHKRDDEERTVAVMATALTQVLRDNPALLQWITDKVGEQ